MSTVIDTLVIQLTLEMGQANRNIADLTERIRKMREEFEKHSKVVEFAASQMSRGISLVTSAIGAMMAAAGAEKLDKWVEKINQMDFNTGKLAHAMGVSVTELDKWMKTARSAGVDGNELANAMWGVVKGLGALETKGDIPPFFKWLADPQHGGLGIADPRKVGIFNMLLDLADKIKSIQDPGKRAAILADFGINGPALIDLLMQGGAKIRELLAVQQKYGLETEEDVRRSEELTSAWGRLEAAADGLGRTITNSLSKPIKEFYEYVTDKLLGFTKLFDEFEKGQAKWVFGDWWNQTVAPPGSTMEWLQDRIRKAYDYISTPRVVGSSGNEVGTRFKQAASDMAPGNDTPAGMTRVVTAGGHVMTLDPQYADRFKGFVEALEKAGAPINSLGSYNYRTIAGTNVLSEHAKGRAIDIDQTDRDVAPALRGWVDAHPDEWYQLLKQYGLKSGEFFRQGGPDFGHIEVDRSAASDNSNPSTQTPSAWPRVLSGSRSSVDNSRMDVGQVTINAQPGNNVSSGWSDSTESVNTRSYAIPANDGLE